VCKLIKNIVFIWSKQLLYQFLLLLPFLSCVKFEVHYLCRAAKLIWADPALFFHCYVAWNCVIITQKLSSNTCYSGSYELFNKAVSCIYKIESCGLTRSLPFWVPMGDCNKYLVEHRWLNKLTHYIFCVHTYAYIYISIYIYIYMCVCVCVCVCFIF